MNSFWSKLPLIIVFSFPFIVYLRTLAPSVAPQGDSGELVTVAYTLGIAHPPGYPLYTLIGHLFSKLPINSVAWRVNLSSAFFHSLTLVFVYLIVKKMTGSVLASMGAALILAFSYTFWLYSLVAEAFPLNDLFAVAIIYITLLAREAKSIQVLFRYLLLLLLLFGLSLSNHHTIVLIIPAIAYLLYPRIRSVFKRQPLVWKLKLVLVALLLFIAGLLPYSYILIRVKTAALPVAWSYPESFTALWHLFTRADYGTFSPARGVDPSLATISEKTGQLARFLTLLLEDYSFLGIGLAILGISMGLFKRSRLAIFLAIGFFFSGVFFLSYSPVNIVEPSGKNLAIEERFYLLPTIFTSLAIGAGMGYLQDFLSGKPLFRLLTLPLVVVSVLFLLLAHYSLVDQKGNYLALELGKNILSQVPKNSLIVVMGDIPTFTTFYARYVEHFRPDVEIVTASLENPYNRFRYLRAARPDLDLDSAGTAGIADLIKANFQTEKYYVFDDSPFLVSGFSVSGFVSSPSGLLEAIYRVTEAPKFEQWKEENERILGNYLFPASEILERRITLADKALLYYYTRMYSKLGDQCNLGGDLSCAVFYYQKALNLDPYRVAVHLNLARALAKKKNCDYSEKEYQQVLDLGNTPYLVFNELYDLAKNCFKDEAKIQFYNLKPSQFRPSSGELKNL